MLPHTTPFPPYQIMIRALNRIRWRFAASDLIRVKPPLATSRFTSQHGQDTFVFEWFKGKKNGLFLDIGANDGKILSNTYFLEKELGWTGLAVEPHPQVFKSLQANRNCDLVQACVGPQAGTCRFTCLGMSHSMLSGMTEFQSESQRKRISRKLAKENAGVTELDLPVVTVNGLLASRNINAIDFLSLDTEGGELDILKSIDFSSFEIGCIAVENNDYDFAFRRFLSKKGFKLVAVAGCDEIYANVEQTRMADSNMTIFQN